MTEININGMLDIQKDAVAPQPPPQDDNLSYESIAAVDTVEEGIATPPPPPQQDDDLAYESIAEEEEGVTSPPPDDDDLAYESIAATAVEEEGVNTSSTDDDLSYESIAEDIDIEDEVNEGLVPSDDDAIFYEGQWRTVEGIQLYNELKSEHKALESSPHLMTAVVIGTTAMKVFSPMSAAVSLVGYAGTEVLAAHAGAVAGRKNKSLEFPAYLTTSLISAFTFENWLLKNSVVQLVKASPKFWSKELNLAVKQGWLSDQFIESNMDIIRQMDMGNAEAMDTLLSRFKASAANRYNSGMGRKIISKELVAQSAAKTLDITKRSEDIMTNLSKKLKRGAVTQQDLVELTTNLKDEAILEVSSAFASIQDEMIQSLAAQKLENFPTKDLFEAIKKVGGITGEYKFQTEAYAKIFKNRHPDLLSNVQDATEGVKDLAKIAMDFGYVNIDDMIRAAFETPNAKEISQIAAAELYPAMKAVFDEKVALKFTKSRAKAVYELFGDGSKVTLPQISDSFKSVVDKMGAEEVLAETVKLKRTTSRLLDIIQKPGKKDVARLKAIFVDKLAELQVLSDTKTGLLLISSKLKKALNMGGEYGVQLDSLLKNMFEGSVKVHALPAKTMLEFLTGKSVDELSIGAGELVKKFKNLPIDNYLQRPIAELNRETAIVLNEFVEAYQYAAKLDKYIGIKGHKNLISHIANTIYDSAITTKPKLKMLQPKIAGEWLAELSKSNKKIGVTGELAVTARAALMRIERICTQLDGFKPFGAAWSNIFNRANQLDVAKRRLSNSVFPKYEGLFEAHREATKIPQGKYWAATGGNLRDFPLTKEVAFRMALNSKHPDNLAPMLAGLKVTKEELDTFLSKAMNAEDWKLADGIFDLLDDLYPILNKIHMEETGAKLARPEGGRYFPILNDLAFDDNHLVDEVSDLFLNPLSPEFHAKVKDTFMLTRKGGAKALRLDMGSLNQHLRDVVHYATHWQTLNDIQKLTRSKRFKEAVEHSMGKAVYKQFAPWLKNLARPERTQLDVGLSRVRKRVTAGALLFQIPVMAKQGLSFVTATPKMGYGNAVKSLYAISRDPAGMIEAVKKSTPEMAERLNTWNLDYMELLDNIQDMSPFMQKVVKWGYYGIRKIDEVTATATHLGGYQKGMELFGGDENKALNYAMYLTRHTQPSSAAKDLPLAMRSGEVPRSLMLFQSYWNVFFNQAGELTAKGLSGHMSKSAVASTLAWMIITPSIITHLAGESFNALTGREQEEEHLKAVASGALSNSFGGLPIAKDIASYVTRGWGYQPTPLVKVATSIGDMAITSVKATKQAGDTLGLTDTGEELDAGDIESVINFLNVKWPIPSSAMITTLRGAIRLQKADTDDMTELFRRPKYKR